MPGVFLIKVCVLLRPGGIEGSGELGIILMVFFCICFWVSVLTLSVFFSIASALVNDCAEVLLWVLIGFAYLGFLILLGNCIERKPLSIICSVKPNKALLVLTSCSSKCTLARPVKPSLISII